MLPINSLTKIGTNKDVTIPLSPIANAEKTPAFLSLLMALAVPIPWLAKPIAKPLAGIFKIFSQSKINVPNDAPIIPVTIVITAVIEGIPPITSDILIAIGAVTFLGKSDNIS